MTVTRILLIEDDPTGGKLIEAMFTRQGLSVSRALSFAEGMACYRSRHYAVIVCDLGLPDSPDPSQTVERLHEFGDTPCIVLTGNNDPDIIASVMAHPGARYLSKPVQPELLLEKVLQAINQREPSTTHARALISAQQELALPSADAKSRWGWQQWLAIGTATFSLLGASGTGGMFLYRSISEEASQSQKNTEHFTTLDKAIVQIQQSMDRAQGIMERQQTAAAQLEIKAALSIEDRAGIHREVGALVQTTGEMKTDLVRRLERIEDKLDKRNAGGR